MLLPKNIFEDKARFSSREVSEAVDGTNFPVLVLKAETPKLLNRQLAGGGINLGRRQKRFGLLGPCFLFTQTALYIYKQLWYKAGYQARA